MNGIVVVEEVIAIRSAISPSQPIDKTLPVSSKMSSHLTTQGPEFDPHVGLQSEAYADQVLKHTSMSEQPRFEQVIGK